MGHSSRVVEVVNVKIVFMGTPKLAAGVLKALYEAGHEISAVVTQPDKPKGRSRALQDRKSTRLNSSHFTQSRMPSSA